MITVDRLSYTIDGTDIIRDFSLTVRQGEVVSLLGPNGCGKSTLLSLILGQMRPSSGTISVNDQSGGTIGIVYQDYRQHLLPYYSVHENILYPLRLAKTPREVQQERIASIQKLLDMRFDLTKFPYQLSGGQAQLASLARALIINPSVIILDEPFSALDCSTCITLQTRLLEAIETLGLTTILVSHSIDESILLADRVIVLSTRPLHTTQEIAVTLPRPRNHAMLGDPMFAPFYRATMAALAATAI